MEDDNLPSGKSDRLLIKALCFLHRALLPDCTWNFKVIDKLSQRMEENK